MPTLAKPLTKRVIDAIAADPARDVFHWDGGNGAVKGFGLRVRKSGRKTFVFQYDDAGGKTRRVTIGHFGALTVEQAREAARGPSRIPRWAQPADLQAAWDRAQWVRHVAAHGLYPEVADDLLDVWLPTTCWYTRLGEDVAPNTLASRFAIAANGVVLASWEQDCPGLGVLLSGRRFRTGSHAQLLRDALRERLTERGVAFRELREGIDLNHLDPMWYRD